MMKMEGYDDCIVGVVDRCGQETFLVYDPDLVVKQLMDDGMTWDEAWEYFHFNQAGAYVGDGTPGFLDRNWEDYISNEEN